MFVDVPNIEWGAWVLGDAPHVLNMACSSVGHGTDVVSASVVLPREERALPQVVLVLPHHRSVARLRRTLFEEGVTLEPDRPAEGSADHGREGWRAELPGIELTVQITGERRP
jgi:hypothetical protein